MCPFQKPCTYQLKRRTEIGQTHHYPILQITGTQIGQIAGKRRLCRNHQPNGAEHHAGHKQREVFFVETRYPAFYGEKKPVERDPFMHFSPLLRLVGQRFNMPPATYTGVQTGHATQDTAKHESVEIAAHLLRDRIHAKLLCVQHLVTAIILGEKTICTLVQRTGRPLVFQ